MKKPLEIPVPECWREAYEKLACEAGLDYFPTRAYLEANPKKSRRFCHWLWRTLSAREGKICEADERVCLNCQQRGLSKWTAMYVLAHIVRDEDPGLYIILRKKLRQYQKGPGPVQPDDSSPHIPLGPLAGQMPVPQPLVFTDAIARELKDKPWLDSYL